MTYELLVQNGNTFVSHIANSIDLRTRLLTAQYLVYCVAELRALNARADRAARAFGGRTVNPE